MTINKRRFIHTVKVGPSFARVFLCKTRSNPCRVSDPSVQLGNFRIDCGHCLDPRAARTDNGNSLTLEIVTFFVACGMKQTALEGLNTRNIRPLPIAISASACQFGQYFFSLLLLLVRLLRIVLSIHIRETGLAERTHFTKPVPFRKTSHSSSH
jgi:hypothetical protein